MSPVPTGGIFLFTCHLHIDQVCVQLDIDGDFRYFLADAAVIAVKVTSFLVLSLCFQFIKLLMFICLTLCSFSMEIPIE